MKIKDLQEKTQVNLTALVESANQGVTNSGAPYLSVVLKDNSGSIDAKYWDVKPDQAAVVKPGTVISVKADVILYKGNLQLKILDAQPLAQQPDLSEYLQEGPVPSGQLRARIQQAVDSIDDFDLKAIVTALYQQYDARIFVAPAAARNHHEFRTGLATHICEMLDLADAICPLYPELNRDLLTAGVLLHDIGKVKELGGVTVTEYTLEGKLLGHVSMSETMVAETAEKLGIHSESVVLLRHMILAHHGQYEYGSPVLPCTLEAEALHFIDDFDAKMTMILKELSHIKPGEFTSRIYAMDNRSFYKPKAD